AGSERPLQFGNIGAVLPNFKFRYREPEPRTCSRSPGGLKESARIEESGGEGEVSHPRVLAEKFDTRTRHVAEYHNFHNRLGHQDRVGAACPLDCRGLYGVAGA